MDLPREKKSSRPVPDNEQELRRWSRENPWANSHAMQNAKTQKRRSPGLSHLGEMVLELLPLTEDARSAMSLSQRARNLLDDPKVVHSEFLVCADGLCVPTDGSLRVEAYRDDHFVIGRTTWERCRSRAHALRRLAVRIAEIEPHDLASEALGLDDLDQIDCLPSDAN